MKKVIFNIHAHGFGLSYKKEEKAILEDALADELCEQKICRLDDSAPESDLPEDLPCRDIFLKQGFSFDQVKKLEDFTQIKGIGKKSASDIETFIGRKLDDPPQPPVEPTQPPVELTPTQE